jgi:3'(2'), 5'-bisphosphate nucleotidase
MSSAQTIDIVELLSVCVDLSKRAGDFIRAVAAGGDLKAVAKDWAGNKLDQAVAVKDVEAGADPVTQADLQAQQVIEGSLHHHFPQLRIIGEEDIDPSDFLVIEAANRGLLNGKETPTNFERNVPIEDVTVYIDPLDATAEFVLGNKQSTATLVGIALKSVAYGGVIHQPFEGTSGTGRTLWALSGFGCGDDNAILEKNITSAKTLATRAQSVLVTTRTHSSAVTEDAIKKLNMDVNLRVGGAGYKVLLLLDGTADVYCYPTPGTKKWDTCAPEAILNFLGGKMTDASGNHIDYSNTVDLHNTGGIFAAVSHELHHKYLTKLKE